MARKRQTWTAESALSFILGLVQLVVPMTGLVRALVWSTIALLVLDVVRRQKLPTLQTTVLGCLALCGVSGLAWWSWPAQDNSFADLTPQPPHAKGNVHFAILTQGANRIFNL